jgi:hypothetical protein
VTSPLQFSAAMGLDNAAKEKSRIRVCDMKLIKWDSKYAWKSYEKNRVESILIKILNCVRKLIHRIRELGVTSSSLLQTNWNMRLRVNRKRLFGNSD